MTLTMVVKIFQTNLNFVWNLRLAKSNFFSKPNWNWFGKSYEFLGCIFSKPNWSWFGKGHWMKCSLSSVQPSDDLIECSGQYTDGRLCQNWFQESFEKKTQMTRKDWKDMKKEFIYLICLNACQYINQDTRLKSYFR